MADKVVKSTRDWMLTVPAASMSLEELRENLDGYRWVGQKEKGEESTEKNPQGYEHYQIFICNQTPIRFETLKKKFPKAHILARSLDPRWSSRRKCFDYVTKEKTRIDGPWKVGNFGNILKDSQGERKDLEELKTMILDQGMSAAEVCAADSRAVRYTSYLRMVEQSVNEQLYKDSLRGPREIKITWLYGKPGSGKTFHARELAGGYKDVYRVSNWSRDPFEKYHYESKIIFDEFFGTVKFDELMNWLDSEPCMLPARYSDKVACYSEVFICSNLAPWDMYKSMTNRDERIGGFYRRIGTLLHVTKSADGERTYTDETDRLRKIAEKYVA